MSSYIALRCFLPSRRVRVVMACARFGRVARGKH
jgi:hypothetical protein